jgi:DNA-binding CsgD family transcriptional regulator
MQESHGNRGWVVVGSGDANETEGLLERDGELGQLAADQAGARDGSGRVVLISGPAGIGKTALLRCVQQQAEGEGMLVLRARGVELEQGFAFGVVGQLFERVLLGLKPGERSRLLTGPARAAGALLGAADPPKLGSEYRAFALLHGLYVLAVNLAERRPMLIVVDDAHWADAPSLRWLSYLAGRLEGLAALVVVAVRGVDSSAADPSLAAIAAESGTRMMAIEALSPEASNVLVERQFGAAAEPAFRAACYAATGGNPFFLGELFRALHAACVAPTAAGAASVAEQGPATLARSVLLRTAGLSAGAGALARALAVLGSDAELRHAAELASLDDAAAADAASRLADAHIIVGEQRLSFTHPIVRSSIYADIPSASRARAHAAAARLLFDAGAAERVSAHLLAAAPAGDAWSVEVLERAAAGALERGAPDSAAVYLRRALAEPPPPKVRQRLLAQLGWAEYLAHERRPAIEHLTDALRLAETADDRATLALRASMVLVIAGEDRSEEAVDIVDRAIPETPRADSPVRMRLEAELVAAAGLKLSTRPRQREWLDRLHARPLGDSHAERLLLANLVCSTVLEGRTPGRFADLARRAGKAGSPAQITRELVERALAGGRLLEEEGPESQLFYVAANTLWLADWFDRSGYWLDLALDAARKRGSAAGFTLASAFQAEVAYRTGNLPAAEAHARAAMSFAPGDVTAVLVNILIDRGELAEAAKIVDEDPFDPQADHLMLQPVIAARGRLAIAQGRRGDGVRDLLAAGAWLDRWPIQNPSVVPWRSTLAAALAQPEERQRARQLATTEVKHARALDQPRSLGIALRVAALLEPRADNIDLLREATSVLESSQARLEHARALTDLGATLRRNRNRTDAREPLRQALDIAHRCGATPLAARAHTELLATGARPRRIALSGADALTATERRIADMAAEGQTTPEIAQALFVTIKTVETHLGHTYQKLDIHSRNQLATALATPNE